MLFSSLLYILGYFLTDAFFFKSEMVCFASIRDGLWPVLLAGGMFSNWTIHAQFWTDTLAVRLLLPTLLFIVIYHASYMFD